MLTRKAFLQEAVRQCIHIFEGRASSLLSFLDPSSEEKPQNDLISLYREAIQLGIDPASGGGNRLRETVKERKNEQFRCNHPNSKKGGDFSSTTNSPRSKGGV